MPGISSILNLAKTGVLSNQFNLHITGNNINNLNTSGYSRQATIQNPLLPSMTYAGPVGNGANVEQVIRFYDRYLTSTLFDKTSIKSGLETRLSGLSAIEQNFNEVNLDGINELLNEFWSAWQDLANNAEGMSQRKVLIEKAELLAKGIKEKYDYLIKLNNEVNINLRNVVNEINKYSEQIADMNVQIISMEASGKKANDLRDQRDELVRKLSELADIHYFETERGTYTVLIGQGSPLVEGDKYWRLETRAEDVFWVGSQGALKQLSAEDVKDGQLGGWLDIQKKIKPAKLTILQGSIINTSRNRPITGETPWEQIDGVTVTGDFTILATGTDQDGQPIRVSFSYIASTNTGPTVEDFLQAIERAFQLPGNPPINRVDARISLDGRLVIEDLMPGNFPISFNIERISGGIYGLNFGRMDGQYPLNYTETLNRWAEQFIKYINSQHSQGIGLIPMTETVSNNRVINQDQPIGFRSSGLKYSDSVQNGYFEIWLYDKDGKVIDFNRTTPEINDPLIIRIQENSTTLSAIRDAINNARFIDANGAPAGNLGINARILQGRLVIQVDGTTEVAGFAFGRDTSNALMALGLNPLFLGHNAATIEVNPVIARDLRLVAAAQVEEKGDDFISSITKVSDPQRPLGIRFNAGSFNIKIYDENLNVVDEVNIPVRDPNHTSIDDIIKEINKTDNLYAEMKDGKINIHVVDKQYKPGSIWTAANRVTSGSAILATSSSGLFDYNIIRTGQFYISRYDRNGVLVERERILIDANTTTLNNIRDAINNAFTGVRAEIVNNQLRISRLFPGDYIEIHDDTSFVVSALKLDKNPQVVVRGKVATLGEDNTGVLKYLGIRNGHTNSIEFSTTVGRNRVLSATAILSSAASGLDGYNLINAGGSFTIRAFDIDGNRINSATINYTAGWTLQDLANAIDSLDFVTASVNAANRLVIGPQSSAVTLVFERDSSNILSVLGFDEGIESFEGVLRPDLPIDMAYGIVKNGSFKVHLFNREGFWQQTFNINITENTTLLQLKEALDALPGVAAFIRPQTVFNGIQNITTYRLVVAPTIPGHHITFSDDTSFVLDALGLGQMERITRGIYETHRTLDALNKVSFPVNDGYFNIYMYDKDGRVLAPELTGTRRNTVGAPPVPVSGGTTFFSMNGVTVSGSFHIVYSGRDQFGRYVTGVFSGTSSSTLNALLTHIENTFGTGAGGTPLVDAFINGNGQLVVRSNFAGMPIAFQIEEIRPVNWNLHVIRGLDFGEFGGFFRVQVDPDYDGLQDIASRLDDLYGIKAWVKDGRIEIEGEHQVARISLADDSSNFLQTFELTTPKGGTYSPANNLNALKIRDLSRREINEFNRATFNGYYQQLVSEVGITTKSVQMDLSYYENTVNQLKERRDNISAVSLDEEMANLIRFQHSFSAAAKLMKVADEMFLSLLEIK